MFWSALSGQVDDPHNRDAPSAVGCDLELIEPRGGAFACEWLTPVEQEMLAKHREAERAQIANLLWTAKEAAAKVRREGLKLGLRHASVTPQDADRVGGMWQALRIDWADGWSATFGWSCAERGRVMAIVTDPRPDPPEQLD